MPTTVLVTTEDKAISALEQMRLLLSIPTAELQRLDDGHTVCARARFGPPLVEACLSVASRIDPVRPLRGRLHRFPDGPSDLGK